MQQRSEGLNEYYGAFDRFFSNPLVPEAGVVSRSAITILDCIPIHIWVIISSYWHRSMTVLRLYTDYVTRIALLLMCGLERMFLTEELAA